jgi:hypothetical protein
MSVKREEKVTFSLLTGENRGWQESKDEREGVHSFQ